MTESKGKVNRSSAAGKRQKRSRLTKSAEELREEIRQLAIDRFQRSTGGHWTEEIATTFRGWIGGPVDYDVHNKRARVIASFWRAVDKVAKGAQDRLKEEEEWENQRALGRTDVGAARCVFSAWVLEKLMPIVSDFRDVNDYWILKERKFSRDVRLIRFVDLSTFLGLGRRPSIEELTAISILLDHDVRPKKSDTATTYFRTHSQRFRKLRSMGAHRKGSPEQLAAQWKKAHDDHNQLRADLGLPPRPWQERPVPKWPPLIPLRPREP